MRLFPPLVHYFNSMSLPFFLRCSACFLKRATAVALLFAVTPARAFDYEGHRVINLLALEALPAGFPAFIRTPAARERVAYLGGEPDRWRNTDEGTLKHVNAPDHFMDLEDLADYGMTVADLPPFRYAFAARLAVERARHPERFPSISAESNLDRTKEWVGFLPWSIAENYAKLESGFSALKAYQEAGTPEEIQNAQESILYVMGTMGHYVGDAAQPLHTTRHFNGWVGENPRGYTTSRGFHAWVDGGYLTKRGGLDFSTLKGALTAAASRGRSGSESAKGAPVFDRAVEFLVEQHQQVEPLYHLDQEKKLSSDGPLGHEGIPFFQRQVVTGARFLAELWVRAWQDAPPDRYLQSKLAQRKLKSRP